nr:hypothetical protein [Nocardioides flavescens]
MDGPGDDHLSADEGDDVLFVLEGKEDVYGEPGADTIYVIPDGQQDEIYCADNNMPPNQGDPGDKLVFVKRADGTTDLDLPATNPKFAKLDHVNYCPPPVFISQAEFDSIYASYKKTPPTVASYPTIGRFLPGAL